ncbi:hypothetical protein NC651_024060 [Populus alba x Populus x berolinensis]|nr:hypothetical protein NC651_024060 [Populus alba x Populus x berolinensis]
MDRPSLVSLLSRILITLCFGIAQPHQFCSNKGTYSVSSTYSNNLNLLLSSLPSSMTENGSFYNATEGQGPDKVYALALCREDLPPEKCSSCVNTTSQGIKQHCPDKKEALTWTDSNCLVRYANRDIFAKMEEEISSFCVSNPNDFSGDVARFNKTLHDLMAELITQASSGPKKFATGYVNFTKPIYGLVQCTPDISERDCGICLQKGMEEMESCSGGREGGRILSPSCMVWFEVFRFYIIPAGNKIVIIIVAAVASLVTLVTIICAPFLWRRMKQKVEKYALQNRFSVKSDVFNFGVLVLEIVTGKKNSWLSNSKELELLLIHEQLRILIDETLRGSPVGDVMRCLHIGLLCVQENVSSRPTMAVIVPMLNSHSWSLPSPSRPAFLLDSNTDASLPSLESDTRTTTQDQSTENTQGTTIC